ncbi:MAG: 4Fe-4S dicluster domain-containing protein [Promethearchaeota archaeon]
MVKIFVGKRISEVPSGLTIMQAMEYLGYKFLRGCGCRGGFCGACATVYRIFGDHSLNTALSCQKTVEEGMCLEIVPFTPAEKKKYDIRELRPSHTILIEYYPEIVKCLCCNTCNKACPQDLQVMDIVQAALKGEIEHVAKLSFECIECGLCALRCPASIEPHYIARLARRLFARYISKTSEPLKERVNEIEKGEFDDLLEKYIDMDVDELKRHYSELHKE